MTISCVTGGNGFIGSHLAHEIRNRGNIVKIADLAGVDVREPLYKSDFKNIDTVYHLAALSNIIPSIINPRDYYETNVTGTFNVLEAARLAGVKKFIYAASASCYGKSPAIPTWEQSPPSPKYPYALTKYLGEQIVMHYGEVYGMDVVSLRIFNCYGNNSLTKSAYGAMFNTFMAQKANNKPLTIIGNGEQSRDFIYVDDVVEAFILAAQHGKGIINVGTGKPTSINRIAEIVGGPKTHIPERSGEPHSIYADITRLKALGWKESVSIEQGIEKMLANIDYWKNAKIWEPENIAKETEMWEKCLG